MTRADLAHAGGLDGRGGQAVVIPFPPCPGFSPKQADLVLNGSRRDHVPPLASGIGFNTVAQVLQTAKMVRLDWQRTVLDAPCSIRAWPDACATG